MLKIVNAWVLSASACLALSLFPSVATAQIINWQPSVDLYQGVIDGSFVNTNGDLAVAYNNTSDTSVSTTVNGVAFTAQTVGTPLTGSTGESITINGGTDQATGFSDGQFENDGDIFNLLRGGTSGINNVTFSGLTAGAIYEVQILTHAEFEPADNNLIAGFSDGVSNGVVAGTSELNNTGNSGQFAGRTGDSITGTFNANSSSLTFNVFGTNGGANGVFTNGNTQSQINAIQLRNIGTAIPEPTSGILLVGGLLAGLAKRRRN